MIILKVKDDETDDEDLELPEWMNVNVPDVEWDGSETSTYILSESSVTSSEEELSSIASSDDDASELDETQNDNDQEDTDELSDTAMSSLPDDTGEDDPDGFDLFPAYHLPNNMDISDDEETAEARGCWYWYLYDKGYVSFPSPMNRETDSEAKASEMESTSGINKKSKIIDSSVTICDPTTSDKSDATISDETTADKLAPLDA